MMGREQLINVGRLKQSLPWWSKVFGKIVLSQIPLSHQFWNQALKVFQHGDMLNPEYAWRVFDSHYTKVRSDLPKEFIACELGPGDSLATAMIAPCYGCKEIYLVDVGNFASKRIASYSHLADFLRSKSLDAFHFGPAFSLEELLLRNNAKYFTDGLRSFQRIPDGKVDFVFSQAVLEHIHLEDFSVFLEELHRILKPGGIASHEIDLRDHLGEGLNNLRFSKRMWESKLFSSSGFYTNRLRVSEIMKSMKEVGFELVFKQETRWEKMPISRNKLHSEFAHFTEDDLLINVLQIVHKK